MNQPTMLDVFDAFVCGLFLGAGISLFIAWSFGTRP